MNRFYVYVHRRSTDNSVFYVGKGCGRRAWKSSGRSTHWRRTADKYGLIVDVVFDNLEENEAFQIERDTILEFKYFGHNLCNKTVGGEGTAGNRLTAEHKQKIRDYQLGRPKSKEAIAKTAAAHRGVPKKKSSVEKMRKALTGKKQSQETKDKRARSLRITGTTNDRNIYVFFSKDDVFIGNRKELSEYSQIPLLKLKPLFGKYRSNVVYGWSVLTINKLIIFKELKNDFIN